LLQVEERIAVGGVESEHFVEGVERTIDEAAALVVEPEAEQNVRLLQPAEVRAMQQLLMDGDGFADLALLAVQVPENHVHFERVGVEAGGASQLFDGEIDLVGDEEVQPEDVMRRLPGAPAVDPFAVPELVALPCFADSQTGKERDERRDERGIRAHASPSFRYEATIESQRPCARRIISTSSRTAPSPP